MSAITIVGAGQIGSRHLQGLKNVKMPLEIFVVDPSAASLKTCQERYKGMRVEPEAGIHKLHFKEDISALPSHVDLAIIASSSGTRRQIIEKVSEKTKVRGWVLEKILFNKLNDYDWASDFTILKNSKCWVNCSMRMMDMYQELPRLLGSDSFSYSVTGSQFGLITNSIHYLDHIAWICGNENYTLDSSSLIPVLNPSKRAGYFEINGNLRAEFNDSKIQASFNCFESGTAPIRLEIRSPKIAINSFEGEGRLEVAKESSGWKWESQQFSPPYQSLLTKILVEDFLTKETCKLASLDQSVAVHKPLLKSISEFAVARCGAQITNFPFT
jgi:predicted dehydrogenase